MNEARTKAVEKLYEKIASGETLTDTEYKFIENYEIECLLDKRNLRKDSNKVTFDKVWGCANKVIKTINNNLKENE